MTGVYDHRVRQARELSGEGVVEQVRIAAVVAVAGARVEERVAADQRWLVAVRQQADMRARVAGRVRGGAPGVGSR